MDDIARDVHCDITMCNDIALYHEITLHNGLAYEPLVLCIIMPIYDVAVSPVKSI